MVDCIVFLLALASVTGIPLLVTIAIYGMFRHSPWYEKFMDSLPDMDDDE